jgi:hypothetical protein
MCRMGTTPRLRKCKVSHAETIGKFAPKALCRKLKHAYPSASNSSGKAARARARSMRRSAS